MLSGTMATESWGNCKFQNLPAGSYIVTIVKAGYVSYKSTLLLVGGENEFLPSLSPPPTATILGKVTDGRTGAALGGVTLKLGGRETVSSSTGMYSLADLGHGNKVLQASRSGYEPWNEGVTLRPGNTIYDVPLQRPLVGLGEYLTMDDDEFRYRCMAGLLSRDWWAIPDDIRPEVAHRLISFGIYYPGRVGIGTDTEPPPVSETQPGVCTNNTAANIVLFSNGYPPANPSYAWPMNLWYIGSAYTPSGEWQNLVPPRYLNMGDFIYAVSIGFKAGAGHEICAFQIQKNTQDISSYYFWEALNFHGTPYQVEIHKVLGLSNWQAISVDRVANFLM